ncbi:hypothetical protein BBJ28_00005907 [Nothophytophthora sp. Chile5]|nr:hypothetical protein BBJ28_00005907 [Nothophytophthora sp. Chile5]
MPGGGSSTAELTPAGFSTHWPPHESPHFPTLPLAPTPFERVVLLQAHVPWTMKLDKAAIRAWCSRDFLVLVLLHLALFATGVTTLYYRHALAASGWTRVVRGAYDGDADSLLVGMNVVGGAAVAVAAMGAVVTVLRRKRLLAGIGACLLLLLGGMVFLAVTVLRVNSRAADWARVASASDDSTSKEAVIAVQFDELYCDAQAAYLCDHATLRELLAFGLGNLTSAVVIIDVEANASSSSNTTESAPDAAAAALCAQYTNSSALTSGMEEGHAPNRSE